MTGEELLERDEKRNLGDELLESVKEMLAEKVGHARTNVIFQKILKPEILK